MVLMSMASKQMVLLELTVPWDAMYADLVAKCWRNGWKAHCGNAEVGGGSCLMSRPETPHDPGYIANDVSKLHHKVYQSTVIIVLVKLLH